MELPKVSIVIAAYNEEKTIGKLLNSIMGLKYPKNKLEVIVVNDGSTDNTVEIVSKYSVKVIMGPHKGVGVARNLGWRAAKGDIVSFIDADLILDKNYVKEIVKTFEDKAVAGSCYLRLVRNKKSLIARMLFLRGFLGMKELGYVIATSFRREILEELSGINPDYGYYDDWELTMRILKRGYRTIRSSKAIVWHNEPENWNELFRQCRWSGKSMTFLLKGYKKEALRHMLFVSLSSFLPIYMLFLFLQFPFNILGTIGLILFLIVELKRSIKMFLESKMKESFLTPLFDFVSMSLTLWGMIIGFKNLFSKSIQRGV